MNAHSKNTGFLANLFNFFRKRNSNEAEKIQVKNSNEFEIDWEAVPAQ